MKIYKIRCAKCGKHFSGESITAIMQENNLEKVGKYFICQNCTEKPQIKSKPKKEKNSFFEKAQDDFQG